MSDELVQVKSELAAEKVRTEELRKEIAVLKQANGQVALESENEEEYRSNQMMKRLTDLETQKEEVEAKVEQEETLLEQAMFKLKQLQKEKVEVEMQMEQEQENIVNKLQKRLEDAVARKRSLEHTLGIEGSDSFDEVPRGVGESGSSSGGDETQEGGDKDKDAIIAAQAKEIANLKKQLGETQREKQLLVMKLARESEKAKEAKEETLLLASEVENAMDSTMNVGLSPRGKSRMRRSSSTDKEGMGRRRSSSGSQGRAFQNQNLLKPSPGRRTSYDVGERRVSSGSVSPNQQRPRRSSVDAFLVKKTDGIDPGVHPKFHLNIPGLEEESEQ